MLDIHEFTKLMKTVPLDTPKPDNGNNVLAGSIWDAYTASICEQELHYFQKRKDRLASNGEGLGEFKKVTVYFSSTETRKMMSRYLVLKTLKREPFTTAEVSNSLRITYKSAAELVSDSLELNAIKRIGSNGEGRYGATCEYVEFFQRIYMSDVYLLNSETERLRQLVTEFGWFERHCSDFASRNKRCIDYPNES